MVRRRFCLWPSGSGVRARGTQLALLLSQERVLSHTVCVGALFGALLVVNLSPDLSGQQPPVQDVAPTFSAHVAPIVYAKCVQCHRPGEVAPMSLINYHEVQPWAGSIRRQLVEQTMPPFHSHSRYGLLVGTPRLTRAEVDTIVRWVDSGAPEGDPALLPELPLLAVPRRNVPHPTP